MPEIYINGTRHRLDPSSSIGKGGEADVYDIGQGQVVKIFKPPDHPDFEGLPHESKGAELRIAEHQQKLPAYPRGLPSQVIAPIDLAKNRTGDKILGFTMPFLTGSEVMLRYSEVNFRQLGVSNEDVVSIFQGLHRTVQALHARGVVIGDFNDLNILVKGLEPYMIDADSFQFGKFLCRVFTERFVDPLLCDPKKDSLLLSKPHNDMSDWYAFAVMFMQTLLCLAGGPYGGVYKPKSASARIAHNARPLHRVTVFNSDVRYPRPSTHFKVLPDELLATFQRIFEKDERGVFPARLLDNLRWTNCSKCGLAHARGHCPECQVAPPQAIAAVHTGTVSGERIFQTSGQILFANSQGNTLQWFYHEQGEYKREDGRVITKGELDPLMRIRIRKQDTILAKENKAVIITPDKPPHQFTVETFGSLPVIDANEKFVYWVENGSLKRTSALGASYSESMGHVLSKQTLIWSGPHFGFGFYRAAGLSQCFTFDSERKGINDSLKLKPFRGQLVDSTCFFSRDRVWFFVSSRVGGQTINSCHLIHANGTVEASAEATEGDGSWLGTLRGKSAVNDFLLAATDDGIVRIKSNGTSLEVEKEFPDSARFVHSGRHLFVYQGGLAVVGSKEIWKVTLK